MPNRNAFVSESPEIAEARAALRTVADRIERELASLEPIAARLREAAASAPALVPLSEDPEATAEGWAAGEIDWSAGEVREGLAWLRKAAEEDFAARVVEEYEEETKPRESVPIVTPSADSLDADAVAVLAILGEPATRANAGAVKLLLSGLREGLVEARAEQPDGFGPDPEELRDGMLVSHDQVRRLLGVLGEPATSLSVGLAATFLNIMAETIGRIALRKVIDGAA